MKAQEYLDLIHLYLCTHVQLPAEQQKLLEQTCVVYRRVPHSLPNVMRIANGDLLLGSTDFDHDRGEIITYVFGLRHYHNSEAMAKTLVHELGHAITPEDHNHDEVWMANCLALGLGAFAGDEMPAEDHARMMMYNTLGDRKDAARIFGCAQPWVNPGLEAFVKALPPVDDWGDNGGMVD